MKLIREGIEERWIDTGKEGRQGVIAGQLLQIGSEKRIISVLTGLCDRRHGH